MSEEKYPKIVMPQCQAEKILKGQKALVTGANSGIGKAVAIALGEAGADVVVNYRREEDQAHEVVAEIEKRGSHAFVHQADVSQEDQVSAMAVSLTKDTALLFQSVSKENAELCGGFGCGPHIEASTKRHQYST